MKKFQLVTCLVFLAALVACSSDNTDKSGTSSNKGDTSTASSSDSSDTSDTSDSSTKDDKNSKGGHGKKGQKEDKKDEEAKEVLPICPQVAVVRELANLRDYGSEDPDPKEFVAAASMLGVDGECEYQPEGINVTFNLNMVALRGPRLGGLHTSFPFFVAVVDTSGKILNKELMIENFSFSSDSKTANTSEALHVFIPLDRKNRNLGPDYRVLMGFQMTEVQLAAIRKNAEKFP